MGSGSKTSYGKLFSFSLQLQTAIGSGFRNSGIMCGKKGKIMLVRESNHARLFCSLHVIGVSVSIVSKPQQYGNLTV